MSSVSLRQVRGKAAGTPAKKSRKKVLKPDFPKAVPPPQEPVVQTPAPPEFPVEIASEALIPMEEPLVLAPVIAEAPQAPVPPQTPAPAPKPAAAHIPTRPLPEKKQQVAPLSMVAEISYKPFVREADSGLVVALIMNSPFDHLASHVGRMYLERPFAYVAFGVEQSDGVRWTVWLNSWFSRDTWHLTSQMRLMAIKRAKGEHFQVPREVLRGIGGMETIEIVGARDWNRNREQIWTTKGTPFRAEEIALALAAAAQDPASKS